LLKIRLGYVHLPIFFARLRWLKLIGGNVVVIGVPILADYK